MFQSAKLTELAEVVGSVITPEVVSDGKAWDLSDPARHQIRLAMFGHEGRTSGGAGSPSPSRRNG